MDAVPSLCATGTIGIAVVGYAFGRPHLTPPSPKLDKRRSLDGRIFGRLNREASLRELPSRASFAPALQPSTRALRRPQSASIPRGSVYLPETVTTNDTIDAGEEWRFSLSGEDKNRVSNEAREGPASTWTGTVKSTWRRRMSTIAASQQGTPTATRPSTPSVSFSNSSNVPFIPRNPAAPRNKLVKRPSSQRGFLSSYPNDTISQYPFLPTLRRPATSHQRSADLQRKSFQDGLPDQPNPPEPSIPEQDPVPCNKPGGNRPLVETWQPFFRSRATRMVREGPSKPGGIGRGATRNETIRSVDPGSGEMPTLLLATAVTKPTEHVVAPPRTPPSSQDSPPRIEAEVDIEEVSSPPAITSSRNDREATPRRSFSLGDFFTSPSPSNRKVPRSTSLRRKKGEAATVSGRRIASEPQPMLTRKIPGNVHTRSGERSDYESSDPLDEPWAASLMKPPSMQLPPLNRLSALDLEIPSSTPSFPTSPMSNGVSTPPIQATPTPATTSHPIGPTTRSRPHRPSGAPSDRASTAFSSDNEHSGIFTADGNELDCRSDTVYDSVRTGATGSVRSGVRGPRLENIFDGPSPPSELIKQNLAALQEKLSNVSLSQPAANAELTADDEDSARTPLGVARSFHGDLATPSRHADTTLAPNFPSSPPSITEDLVDGDGFEYDGLPAEEDWSGNDKEIWDDQDPEASDDLLPPFLRSSQRSSVLLAGVVSNPPLGLHGRPKSNIFEWSEPHGAQKDGKEDSLRPKTVHGKQGNERSRTSGRRGPSALHLRSQSVPLPPDASSHRGFNNASKLDAWMLGGKGVSEDWDGDFEFDEPSKPHGVDPSQLKMEEYDSNGVVIPRSILERQASVRGQFGQVKELTLLVEELKRLHHLAGVYGLLHGRASELWKEAEGIVDLATLDDEDQDFFPPRSPTSTNFEYDPFEEDSPTAGRRHKSNLSSGNDDPLSRLDINVIPHAAHSSPGSKFGTPPAGRPRKESVAQVKSVLENIQHHRVIFDAPTVDHTPPPKKMPFDTTSLRDLVTRAGVVTRALKEIVRKVEDVDNTPNTPERQTGPPPDPPFSQIFYQASSPASASRSSRITKSSSGNSFLGGSISGNDNDIMKMMTVV